jgi:hypothetical protein
MNNITPIDDCGCNGPKLMLNEGKNNILLSEGLSYHIQEGRMLIHNIYRPLSSNYMALFREARALYNEGLLSVIEDDAELLESNLGEYGIYEGIKVPLDYPISLDELINLYEQGEDTSWSRDENTVTLQDILNLTKNIPTTQYPTEKLAKIVLNWDDNPEEIKRISQVEISEQYPILIMVDEKGKLQWILDGNHRAQKALRSQAKTIPAKLIKPSNLSPAAKKVLLGKLNEAEFKGKKVSIGKPKRGGSKKFYVYVKDGDKVKKVSFGDTTGLRAKLNDPKARKAFAARHDCKNKKDRTKASYWSCRLPRYAKMLGFKTTFSGFW